MRSLIIRLIVDREMTNNYSEGIEECSNLFSMKFDYEIHKFGSNYVPDKIAMSMTQEGKNKEVIGVIHNNEDDELNVLPEYDHKFNQIWSLYIFL